MRLVSLFLLTLFSFSSFAGGKGPMSTIPSWVNFLVLIAGLIYLVKDKATTFFRSKSENILEMMNRAASKAKEAQSMMEIQQKKISGVHDEINAMKKDQEQILKEFEENYKADVEQRIVKLKEDAAQKIEAEKAELLNELNANLLDLVISNTKKKIKSDSSLAQTTSSNIVKGL